MKKILTLLLAFPLVSLASPGHDHGDEAPAPTTQKAAPRFSMQSEQFEVVGILNGHHLQLYVDQAKTNAPVENATAELTLNGTPVPVALHQAGLFEAEIPEALEEEHLTVSMNLRTKTSTSTLTGELNLEQHPHDEPSTEEAHSHASPIAAYGVGAAALLLLAIGFVILKKRTVLGRKSS